MSALQLYKNSSQEAFQSEKCNVLAEDVSLPAMVLKNEAIEGNIKWMQSFAEQAGVKLAPHGKTTMCPSLFKRQLEAGAWGMTLATAFQVKVAYEHGVKRVLMANQLVGKQNILSMIQLLKKDSEFEFYCLVDHIDNVEAIFKACRDQDLLRPFQVLIEVAPKCGRAGLRERKEILALAQAMQKYQDRVKLVGIECYEGVIHGENAVEKVKTFLTEVSEITVELEEKNLFHSEKLLLTGGGTVFFDLVSDSLPKSKLKRDFEVLIRPGCYLSHDSGIYDDFQNELLERSQLACSIDSNLTSAIEVLAYVQSNPEPGLAILNIGKRDVSFDSGLPVPKSLYTVKEKELTHVNSDWSLVDLNDQHAFLSYPKEAKVCIGDIVVLSVSHPCLTFDKWQSILMVNKQYDVIENLQTFFG